MVGDEVDRKVKYFVAQTHDRPRGGRAKIRERMGFLVLFHPNIDNLVILRIKFGFITFLRRVEAS